MLLLVCALECEAAPFKQRLRLKKDPEGRAFPVFSCERAALVVSGVGKLRAAAATAHLLTRYPRAQLAVNLGLCGSLDPELAVGSAAVALAVEDAATRRRYHPDMLVRHELCEVLVRTSDHPVGLCPPEPLTVVDMEASGFAEAAWRFLSTGRIGCLKVVSDHLEPGAFNPATGTRLVEQAADRFSGYLEAHLAILDAHPPPFTSAEEEALRGVGEALRLTFTQKGQLREKALIFKVSRGGDLVPTLAPFAQLSPASKSESRARFAEIDQRLSGA